MQPVTRSRQTCGKRSGLTAGVDPTVEADASRIDAERIRPRDSGNGKREEAAERDRVLPQEEHARVEDCVVFHDRWRGRTMQDSDSSTISDPGGGEYRWAPL